MPLKWFDKNSKEVFNEEEFAYEKFKHVQLNKWPYDNFYQNFEIVKKGWKYLVLDYLAFGVFELG